MAFRRLLLLVLECKLNSGGQFCLQIKYRFFGTKQFISLNF